jgi:predicted metalloprotease with PDZ domain
MDVQYILQMPQPHSHYLEVKMELKNISAKILYLKMAVWTPGSYLIREYAKNVEGVSVMGDEGKMPEIRKISKNTWQLNSSESTSATVSYRVYANELAVRNCYLDDEQAYINPASVFLYVKGSENRKSKLKVDLPAQWKQVITALKPIGNSGTEFEIQNLDEFIDSPILCGNPDVMSFDAGGVRHRVAFQGNANVSKERIKADFTKIVEAQKALFGHHPCQNYTFIVHHVAQGGGGLEHSHSSSLQTSPATYESEMAYQNFLGLVSHEYFHLWNVKRLRPHPLGPFDYENENYTSMLWFSEGFTSYYDDFFLFRAGISKKERFLDVVASNISRVESVPGMYNQSLSEASLDAWIKYYRPNENSQNSQSDYYTKGAAMGTWLDLLIIKETAGARSLDDLMRDMYGEFYLKRNSGFTESDFEKALSKEINPKKARAFMAGYIDGLEKPDWAAMLSDFGIRMTDRNEAQRLLTLGLRLQGNGKVLVQGIPKNGPAYHSGIYVGDEVISIAGKKIENTDLSGVLAGLKAGEEVQILFSRAGQIRTAEVLPAPDQAKNFRLEWMENVKPEQELLRKKWLRMN